LTLLNKEQLAAEFNVSPRTVEDWVLSARIPTLPHAQDGALRLGFGHRSAVEE
jgi:hypothetical protein